MRIHKIELGEIYIDYLFRIKEKPRLQSYEPKVHRKARVFPEEIVSAVNQTVVQVSYLTDIFFTADFISSAFGIVIFKTPALKFALILSSSISEVSSNERLNVPQVVSYQI